MGFDTSGLLPLSDALQGMLAQLDGCCDSEQLPLPEALGRVLAMDIASPLSVPPFDNSAMDGYAVRLADLAGGAPHHGGQGFAGQPYQGEWPAGHCVRIMTGAPVPAGTDAVVMQEETQADGDRITFLTTPVPSQNIRRRGEDIREGASVLAAGTRITAREMPLLASLGIASVPVRRPLKVAIFSTGDELKPIGTPLAHGDIYDSNRYGVRAMLDRMGCDCLDLGIIPDDPAQLRAAFHKGRSRGRRPHHHRRRLGGGSGLHQTAAGGARRDRLLEAGHQARQAVRLRSPAPFLVLRPAGQPGLRHGHLRSAGASRRWPSWPANASSARFSCQPLPLSRSRRHRAGSTSSAAS